MKDLNPDERQLLYEYFTPTKDYSAFHGSEGLIVEPKGHLHALINTEDHLILNFVDEKNHLEEAWHTLLSLENELSKEIEFAFSQKFGFLTSDLKKCGTGLEVSLILHLPALIHTDALEQQLEKMNFQVADITSFLGEHDSIKEELSKEDIDLEILDNGKLIIKAEKKLEKPSIATLLTQSKMT